MLKGMGAKIKTNKNQELDELKKIMRKVRSMKIVSSCIRDINEAKKK